MSSPPRKNFLVKSEPSEYSIQQLQQDHHQEWDGVRNYTARNHLNTMKPGDKCFFYHSSCKLPSIVGTCRIARAAQPDQTAVNPKHKNFDPKSTESNRWVSVLVEFEALFETSITIKELRMQATINPVIANMSLLRQSRLSVMPVSDEEWQAVLDLQTRKEQGEDLEQLQQQIQTKEKQRRTKRTEKVAVTTSTS
ncbi:EVE domain containing protein [Nitzschia inconspicua]|uniref:EVE domain containing protein n=1 Tax=Nitzschia inconspicua TaxID=303405 RepID=A0A9K3Q1E9_9STRA|nr:EVE domain containing protein [Nitzschia inconspicua]